MTGTRISDMTLAAPPSGHAYVPFVVPDRAGGLDPNTNYFTDIGGTRVDVRSFGAVGDGSTVDTLAINLAIASLTTGQTLYFPPGTYLVDNSDIQNGGASSTVPLPIGANLEMDGSAWLRRASNSTTANSGVNFITPLGDNRITANIDGDEFPTSGGIGGTWAVPQSIGIYALAASNVTITNSFFKNLGNFGIRVEAPISWKIVSNRFYRIRNSGGLFVAMSSGPVEDLLIMGNFVDTTGDTGFACTSRSVNDLGLAGYRVTGVNMVGNVCRDTQLLIQGFALDIEGGFDFGKQFGNRISNNVVIQETSSTHGQGGVTMNLFNEDSQISGNVLISGTFEHGDCGVSVPGTRNIQVHGNTILGFRGQAIWADGATAPSIRGNAIRNCGDATDAVNGPKWSAIVLSWEDNSIDAVCSDNDLWWPSDYTYGGSLAAGILINMGDLSASVQNATIRNNRLKNPLGVGIWARGFTGGFTLSRVAIENNSIIGEGSGTVFLSNPIAATYCIGLSVQGNRAYETKKGFDLTASTNVQVKGNTIENITTSPTLASWLDLTSTDKAWAEGNKFNTSAPTAKLVTTSATNLTIRRNDGYKTENFGTSAAIATGATIAHGLDVTPTSVSLVAQGVTAAKVAATVDATNITVTHDSGGSTAFFWRAEG